ncbi:MAG: hypothetical protein WAL63_04745 [Solirubrobacteraceae bacterium]
MATDPNERPAGPDEPEGERRAGLEPEGGRPAGPEQPEEGFAEGEARPDLYPEDEVVGRFSEGQEELPVEVDPEEKVHHGRFSEGQEDLPEEDPEKHEERRFSEGQDMEPPGLTP